MGDYYQKGNMNLSNFFGRGLTIRRLANVFSRGKTMVNKDEQRLNAPTKDRPLLKLMTRRATLDRGISLTESYKGGFLPEEVADTPEVVKRVLRLENATPSEIKKFRIAQALKKFQTSPTDSGTPTVQIAAMSERIIHMINYLNKNRRDKEGYRALQKLVDRRRKLLNYLMRKHYHLYKWVISEYRVPDVMPMTVLHKTMKPHVKHKSGTAIH
eukprot:TRINITY_DN9184_c0_g1_i1.p1 TRINITY_DN9184_c0_g1~~TRINITY_DN9184_c0_g1_i1.p1  ORF type:complete len:213 (+),score=29.38 TRINITY_DN9184_c0_g1_i1:103-741(+)